MDDFMHEGQPKRRLEFESDKELSNSCIDDQCEKLIHARISKDIIPVLDMKFDTEDEAYNFYNSYAKAVGFSIRKSKAHSHMGKVLDRIFVCLCEGKREQDKREDVYKSHRAETRCGCLAMMKINCRNTSKYSVVKFIDQHNHNLGTPSKVHLFRSHRRLTMSQATEVDMEDLSGIAPRNTYELMAKQAGGRESLGFSRVDLNNYLRNRRNVEIKPGETKSLLGYLQTMRFDDPNFFYALQVDECSLITNIFWADSKMISDYDDFGDVVCFDTTYRKHKDGRPIGLFVGVSHHRKTIIFGVALLYDESTDAFIWLFDTFVKAMGGKSPKTMITDQDAAMSKAIACQWPNTYHRLCIWHIFQNAATHLSHVYEAYTDFASDFNSCIYDHEYEKDFLSAWDQMLQKYNLQDHPWLKRMFSIKEKWAMVYGRDTFCADMISTQRSESMNKVIKHYVSSKHDLPRFFEHFQRLLDDRRYDELLADFKANHSKVVLSMPIEILKHVASVYTPEVFKLVQAESTKAYDCIIESSCCGETAENVIYTVRHVMKQSASNVSYNAREELILCSCKKYEFTGILCCHILAVLSSQGVIRIPDKYILRRWTKDAKKGSVKVISESSSDLDPQKAMACRYRELCRLSTHMVTRAAETEEAYAIVKEGIINLSRYAYSNTGKHLESCQKSAIDPGPNLPLCENDKNKSVSGLKLKPKPGHASSKRLKRSIDKTKRSRKAKKTKSLNDGVQSFIGNQADQVTTNAQFEHPTQGYMPSDSIQQIPFLSLLQHPQCDDLQAYANLLHPMRPDM